MPARNLNTLFQDANYLLVFLPIANFLYVYTQTGSTQELILALFAALVCSYALNYSLGIPDPKEYDYDIDTGVFGPIYLISILLLSVVWGYSAYQIYKYIGVGMTYVNIFFILSVGWPFLLIIHSILHIYIEDYSNPLFAGRDATNETGK